MRSAYTLDLVNQLSNVTNSIVGGGTISQYGYTFDNVGNRLTMNANGSTHNYSYNNIYELTGVSGAQTHSFAYDNVANRTTADTVNYTSNSVNQYTQVGGVTPTYDANGNLITDGSRTLTYDEENRLKTAQYSGNSSSYTYDGFNRRVSKTVNSTTTYFLQDGDVIVAEYNSSGALQAEYVHGARTDEVLTMDRGGTRYYYHYDGLGSVTEVTNGSGTVVENYTYDIYGQPSVTSSLIGNPYRFTGRQFDEETRIYQYRNRMYDPTLGRFLQRDPIGYYDSMNLFQYVRNNPVNWVDPFGERCEGGSPENPDELYDDAQKNSTKDPKTGKPYEPKKANPDYPEEEGSQFREQSGWWQYNPVTGQFEWHSYPSGEPTRPSVTPRGDSQKGEPAVPPGGHYYHTHDHDSAPSVDDKRSAPPGGTGHVVTDHYVYDYTRNSPCYENVGCYDRRTPRKKGK